MNKTDYTELGKRAAACKGFRWMPGMRTVRDDGHGFHIGCTVTASKVKPEWLPDLTDPATLGCLLALVREAYDDSMIVPTTVYDTDERVYRWYTIGYGQGRLTSHGARLAHPTEAAALVAALEAAP